MEMLAAACSLSSAELAEVRERYAAASNTYTATATFTAARATIHLRGELPVLRALLDEMVQRESGCCSFLRFEVEEAADGLRVALSAPGAPEPDRLLQEAVGAFFPSARFATPAQ